MADKPIYEKLKGLKKDGVKQLYEQYGRKLYGYGVHSWKLTEDESWELVYKALYKVCENIDKYSFANEKAFASFLFTVFINLMSNYLRDNHKLSAISIEDIGEPIADEPAGIKEGEMMQMLKEELDQMEDWQRILLLLRCQDIPYSEISRYTGKSADILKVYYGRLKDKLGKKITHRITTEISK